MSAAKVIPNEIFAAIFRLLDRDSLLSASLVSRRLHAITNPILYREVELTYVSKPPPSLQIFLRTILIRPMLAKHVRVLILEWENFSVEGLVPDLSPNDVRLFTSAATNIGLPHSPHSQGAQVVLLLHLLPNLQDLDIYPPHDLDIFNEFMEANAFSPIEALPVGLRYLRTLRFCSSGCIVTPKTLLTMFKLPRIRSIDVHITDNEDLLEDLEHASAPYLRMSSVTELTFSHGTVTGWLMARILAIPRALTYLSYVDSSSALGKFDSPVFGLALRTVHGTLRYMRLGFPHTAGYWGNDSDDDDSDDDDNSRNNTIGSLRDWPVLRSVRCPLTPLLGRGPGRTTPRLVDVLPLVIMRLTVDLDRFWTVSQVVDHVVDLLEQKQACGLDQLAVVTIGWVAETVELRLRTACGSAGVELVVMDALWR